jgi:hypothetical protein
MSSAAAGGICSAPFAHRFDFRRATVRLWFENALVGHLTFRVHRKRPRREAREDLREVRWNRREDRPLSLPDDLSLENADTARRASQLALAARETKRSLEIVSAPFA